MQTRLRVRARGQPDEKPLQAEVDDGRARHDVALLVWPAGGGRLEYEQPQLISDEP